MKLAQGIFAFVVIIGIANTQAKQLDQPDEICFQPIVVGPCESLQRRYAYNAESGRCELFFYGGCQGNQNNFESVGECFDVCGGKPPVVETGCNRAQCNWKRFAHYIAKECEPIYEGGSCCPTRFKCATEEELGKSPDSCYYKRREYKADEPVPIEHPCLGGCFCGPSFPGEVAEISCGLTDCGSLFNPPEPGCRNLYTPGRCCESDMECVNPDLEPRRDPECVWKGNTWLFGDLMSIDDEPCQTCVCTPDFTDPRGPGCNKIDCRFEFVNRNGVIEGCTPTFFEDGCCHSGYICPGDQRIVKADLGPQMSGACCKLGNISIAVGASLPLSECDTKCLCQTPPELTCTRYRSCELAEERRKSPNCPQMSCPTNCRVQYDSSTGCSNCFCGNKTKTCPKPTCEATCANQLIQFDESVGCYVCKCM